MKGLIIWAHSTCRSTIHLYDQIARMDEFPVKVALWHHDGFRGENARADTGFVSNECTDLTFVPIGNDYRKGVELLDEHRGWNHLFAQYQASRTFRLICAEALRRGERAGVICEAPCNMESGWRRMFKAVYMRTLLPAKVRNVVRYADFFVNQSGDSTKTLGWLGWPGERIIPFGYYLPPIEGARLITRRSNRPFEILCTGVMSKYRGADVLMRALVLLKKWGVPYHATFTQGGELLESLKQMAVANGLPVDFPGLLSLKDLVLAYELCSVFVGPGIDEPWGMRVNDALQCGAPIVISTGMGAVRLVGRYGCGCTFTRNDHVDLANKLKLLAIDDEYYQKCVQNAVVAADEITPHRMAHKLMDEIRSRAKGWN